MLAKTHTTIRAKSGVKAITYSLASDAPKVPDVLLSKSVNK